MNHLMNWAKPIDIPTSRTWTRFFLRYASFMGLTNLAWESIHLPLYTLWTEGDLGDLVFLPRTMFDASAELTLDDVSPAEIGERLGVRVEVAGTMGEVVALTVGRGKSSSTVSRPSPVRLM